MSNLDVLKQFYTTIYAQCYSSCGKFLAVANNYGNVILFNLTPFLNSDEVFLLQKQHSFPVYQFQAHKSCIYSLASNDDLLITGSIGELNVWSWKDLKKKEAKTLGSPWKISQGDNLTKTEVNCLAISSKESKPLLFAGCGDNKIYTFDIETRKILSFYEGHDDYIHSLCLSSSGQECVSGSEDGSVRIWDTRKKGEAVHKIYPHKHESLNRPRLGKWISCVALDANDDWLVCGGGPTLCLWHMRSLNPAVPLLTDSTANVALFNDDMIISGGSSSEVYHWSYSGEIKAEVSTSGSNIFSIAISEKTQPKLLSIAGTSNKIDICTNFMYRDFSLTCI